MSNKYDHGVRSDSVARQLIGCRSPKCRSLTISGISKFCVHAGLPYPSHKPGDHTADSLPIPALGAAASEEMTRLGPCRNRK
jgi:hypothetical protein